MKRRNTADEDNKEELPQEEEEEQEPPPRKMSRRVKGGQIRKYYFLETVKSLEEMDKFRFKNFCHYSGASRTELKLCGFRSAYLPCGRKIKEKTCDFELMAVRPGPDLKSGIIHIYAHSEHNHPFMSAEQRSRNLHTDLMQPENPPRIYRTPDNIEWQFLQSFSDFDKMQKSRDENQCKNTWDCEKWGRIRFVCKRKRSHDCGFVLLAMKTTNQGFHIYKHGEHKHNKLAQRKSRGQMDENQQVIEDEEEDEQTEGNSDDEDENEAEMPSTSGKITKFGI